MTQLNDSTEIEVGAPLELEVKSRGQVMTKNLLSRVVVLIVWLLMIVVFSIAEPHTFFQFRTFQAVLNSQTPLVFLALSLLCTMCVGEFVDLSFASIMGLTAMIISVLTVSHLWNVWLATALGLGVAVLIGIVNAVLVVYVRISTIVVTLGMGTLLLGIALWSSNLSQVYGLPASYDNFVNDKVLGLPLQFYYGIGATLIFAYVMGFTPLGRHIRAVGSSHEVSRLAGVRVRRIRFGAFVMAGFLAGVAGVMAVGSLGGFDPSSSQLQILPTFAAVFLGTSILMPGRFNAPGTFLAIYFLETGILGLQLLGLAGWIADVFYGGILIVAAILTTVTRRRTT